MKTRVRITKLARQIIFLVLVMTGLGYFSHYPTYVAISPQQTQVKLIVRRSGHLLGQCHEVSALELSNTPKNMRLPRICPREKSSLDIQLRLSGKVVFKQTIKPAGLHNDGILAAYRVFTLNAGPTSIQLFAKEQTDQETYSSTDEMDVILSPDHNLVIYFDDTGFHIGSLQHG